MALVVHPFRKPADLEGTPNGQLWPHQLEPILLPGVGMGTLHPLAARAFNWLFWQAKQDTGQTMTATSNADDYRSYDMQKSVFLQRMSRIFIPIVCTLVTRMWEGVKYWLKRGNAQVATPGTSNHGWGCALDCALWVEVKPGQWKVVALTTNPWFWAWLSAPDQIPVGNPWRIGTGSNAESFGLSWENQTETWHLRYNQAEDIPKRIIDLETYFTALGVQPT